MKHILNLTYIPSGTVIREEVGLSIDKVGSEVLGHAAKVVLTKETTTIVGDGSTQDAVNKRVAQIKNLVEVGTMIILSPVIVLTRWICLVLTVSHWGGHTGC